MFTSAKRNLGVDNSVLYSGYREMNVEELNCSSLAFSII